MKKTILEKLGLAPVKRLNKKVCLERVKELERRIDTAKVPRSLIATAKAHARWYQWAADQGGTREKINATAKKRARYASAR